MQEFEEAHEEGGGRITSKSTFLFMEHSISWSVILIFLWENIFKQETLQNPQFFIQEVFQKLVSDSAIIVGKYIQTRNTSNPTFLFMEHSKKLVSDSEIHVG